MLVFASLATKAQVGIGVAATDVAPSAQLEVKSTTKGLLIPRMTEAQKTAISNPATGLLVYQTDGTSGFYYFDGSVWKSGLGPKGDRGEIGQQGPRGLQGIQGPQGNQGDQGPQGEAGPIGAVGPQGNQGDQGPQGEVGPQGATGPQGEAGPIGATGPQGEAGPIGADGPQGPRGDQGPQGEAGPQGATGPQGEAGPIGAVGPQGNQGDQGPQGEAGPVGATGPQGEAGPIGATGPQGDQGPQGNQGEAGPVGATGPQGATGPAGSDASITMGSIAGSSTANGGSISSGVLSLAPADATNGGIVTTGTQTFAGSKTFNSDLKVNGINVGKGNGSVATNTAIGSDALRVISTGIANTSIGYQSLYNVTSGNSNTSIGYQSLFNNTTGGGNDAFGINSLNKNTTGLQNTAMGQTSLYNNTTGQFNTATGAYAVSNNTTGNKNTGVGNLALGSNYTGSNNTAIGFGADVTTDGLTNATAIGYQAVVDASNKIQLGNSSVTSVKTSATITGRGLIVDTLYSRSITTDSINTKGSTSPLVFKQNNTELMRLATTGNLLIGTPTQVNAGDFISIKGTTLNTWPLNSYSTDANAAAIYGEVTSTATASANVWGAVQGQYKAAGNGAGVSGIYQGSGTGNTRAAVRGEVTNNTSTGLIGSIGTCGVNAMTTGTQRMGLYGQVSSGAYGFGVYGIARNGVLLYGSFDAGVVGWVGNNANFSAYFNGNYAVANGTKSASVGTTKGNQLLYCTESPEVWFEDMGSGKLVNGVCRIDLDDLFKEVTVVDEAHPMHVFIQMEGESEDVFVIKDKNGAGFTVKERNHGNSNADFSYKVSAKRVNFQDHRFGSDPVWGSGDTRKYMQYSTPPSIDYNTNIKIQEEKRNNYKQPPLPAGFMSAEEIMKEQSKNKSSKGDN